MVQTSLITLRLPGTIPAATGRELKALLVAPAAPAADGANFADGDAASGAAADPRRAQKEFFARFDDVLDRAPIGQGYFADEKMAEVLAGEIMMLEETGFVVHGFAILPNHAHAVLHLPEHSRLSFPKALDLLHARTAANCRRLVRPKLPPEVPFWQVGWHEYIIGSEAELTRVLAYVAGNARKAGLPARFQAWPYGREV